MMDDPLEWLDLGFDDDDPTIPDAIAWHDPASDDQTHRTSALDADEDPPDVEWELELESELRPPLRASQG